MDFRHAGGFTCSTFHSPRIGRILPHSLLWICLLSNRMMEWTRSRKRPRARTSSRNISCLPIKKLQSLQILLLCHMIYRWRLRLLCGLRFDVECFVSRIRCRSCSFHFKLMEPACYVSFASAVASLLPVCLDFEGHELSLIY